MKILFLTYGALPFPPSEGGAIETLLQTLVDENETYQKCQFTIISREGGEGYPPFEYTDVVTTRIDDNFLTKNIRLLKRGVGKVLSLITHKKVQLDLYPEIRKKAEKLIKSESFDYIVDLNCIERISKLRPQYMGKYILYFHNDYLNKETYKGNRIYQEADGIVSVCDFLNHQVQKIPDLVVKENFYRVNNGIKLEKYRPVSLEKKAQLKEKLGIPIKDTVIVFSGRVTPTKGVDILLRALQETDPEDVTVLIIGGITYSSKKVDKYTRHLHELANNLKANVVFTGYISSEEMSEWLAVADIATAPSIFHETCCLSAVEAQAMGLPVVVTAIGGIPEYISKESAFFIDYTDKEEMSQQLSEKLCRLIDNDSLRYELAEKAVEQRERHSAKRYYEEFVEVINKI